MFFLLFLFSFCYMCFSFVRTQKWGKISTAFLFYNDNFLLAVVRNLFSFLHLPEFFFSQSEHHQKWSQVRFQHNSTYVPRMKFANKSASYPKVKICSTAYYVPLNKKIPLTVFELPISKWNGQCQRNQPPIDISMSKTDF